jgi:ATP-dependent DNA helicase RecQ
MGPQQAPDKYFGFREFREPQGDVVSAVLNGEDVVVVMPTGGGKSLCYQLPAILLDGVTIVVSPLIALMKDQVDALLARGVAATLINSTISASEQRERIRQMRNGGFKLVYIAPERFRSRSFVQAIGQITIAFFAIDEAHCISQWGHDFRPDYFRLGPILKELGNPPTGAFTATATAEVRDDILARLGLENPKVFIAGFARPNLRFIVTELQRETDKYDRLREVIRRHKTGIVYCATRKRVDEVSEYLSSYGVKVVSYHGGYGEGAREEAQNQFTQNRCDVVVATNAFGMGIDRADLRFVLHFEIPGSLEAYYQEAGRAGRDGEPAECELLFNYADTRIQEFFIDGNNPGMELIRRVYSFLMLVADEGGESSLSIHDLAARLDQGTNEMAVHSALTILARQGVIDRYDIPGKRARGTRVVRRDLNPFQLPIDVDALREKEKRDRSRLKAVVDYAYGRECRQKIILRYFGDVDFTHCGTCDRCLNKRDQNLRPPDERELLIVRKALSGVARMSYRTKEGFQPRFGRARIIQTLLGSQAKEVTEYGLDTLTVYGLLRASSSSYLHQLFREMEESGLIYSTGGQYPLIGLTELGVGVMQNRTSFEMAWPAEPKTGRRSKVAEEFYDAPFDQNLFEALRNTRAALARNEGGVPHYVIFPDETLKSFARLKPNSVEAARKIRGVGEIKAEKYMQAFLKTIAEYC